MKIVQASGPGKFKFKDHNRQGDRPYTYFIVSVDAAGNQSIAAKVKVKPDNYNKAFIPNIYQKGTG